ncbi:hypothetical protein ACH0BF_07665 [Pseudobacillus sp. 179-B 2D1 NHS]|uniref:hypothetical protein n=1 Tax=Pseudobacillus sp. 179-B 2D1 NHS TaxID=3374292 RepID=UPI000E755656|nr:hypothetical protein CJ483_14525 [Bacillus sp. PK3_68]
MFGGCLPVDHRTTDSPSLNHEGNLVDKGNGNAEQKKRIEKEERQISALLLPAFFIGGTFYVRNCWLYRL